MDIFLARQAIYNRIKEVVAYELLYRNSLNNRYDTSIDATYAVIEKILSFGLENIINNKKALINCEEKVLLSDAIFLLPKNSIIIEILETLNELSKIEVDIDGVENLIKSDVILTYKLINYINSAHFGFRMEIS